MIKIIILSGADMQRGFCVERICVFKEYNIKENNFKFLKDLLAGTDTLTQLFPLLHICAMEGKVEKTFNLSLSKENK